MHFLRAVTLTALLMMRLDSAAAHEIPADITVQAYLKPSDHKLQLIVRVPLRAMRDIEFPEFDGLYLHVEALAPRLRDPAKLWISDSVAIFEDGKRLPEPVIAATQISIPSDPSFASFDQALQHVTAPMLRSTAFVTWDQVFFDVLFEYPIASDRSEFAIRPGFERLAARVATVLRFVHPDGAVRVYEFLGDPGTVRLDPRWYHAAAQFVHLGFVHILSGTDHLLFLLCLVVPIRQLRPLVVIVTAFTLAHSITLIASAFEFAPQTLWFPPLIETLIAASIVYMALENIVAKSIDRRRWFIAFGFGLIHGFGFSFALRETLQLAGSHVLSALFAFNVGVELGQIAVLLLAVPMLNLFFRFAVAERIGVIILSAFVAHTGWHWMLERAEQLRQYRW